MRSRHQHLFKCRRRYCRLAFPQYFTTGNGFIDFLAEHMQSRGLYSSKSDLRGIRQSIQSHMFRIYGKGTWYKFLSKHRMDPWTGYFHEKIEPAILDKLKTNMDGDQWCVLYGKNVQRGIAGFGDTLAEAIVNWNTAWNKENK